MKERNPDKWQRKDDQKQNESSFMQLHVADLAVTQLHNIFLAHLVQHKDTEKMSTETPAHWLRNPMAAQN